MRMSRTVTAWGAAVALTGALTSCSTGGGPSPTSAGPASPASIGTLKQQAQGEHGLLIYGNVPSQYFQPVITAFNKQYPSIKVNVADLSDNVVFSKYEAV